MDKIDQKILQALQQDGRLTNQDLAEKIALSPSPCLRRVKQLHEDGIIQKYVALLNPEKIGLNLTVTVAVGLANHDPKLMNAFEQKLASFPEVVECYLIAGQTQDYQVKVIVSGMESYQQFLMEKLTQIEGVSSISSNFILKSVVHKTELPLTYLR